MKRLATLRHAKSSWDHPGLGDFDRPLNDRGWKAARRLGREFDHRSMHFDLVLASPAARVRETIDGIEEKYDFHAAIRFDQRLYLADVDSLLSLLRELPDMVDEVLLVGHNPGLERLLLALAGDEKDARRNQVAAKYPTGAFAIAELAIDQWTEAGPGCGRIVELIVPKDLD